MKKTHMVPDKLERDVRRRIREHHAEASFGNADDALIDKTRNIISGACGIAGIMSFLALASWPYPYYTALRWIVCIAAGAGCVVLLARKERLIPALLAATAVLFNPLRPIHLDRSVWWMIDIAVGILLLVAALRVSVNSARSEPNED